MVPPQRRRWWLLAISTLIVLGLATLLLKPTLEQAVRTRIESAALRHGATARIGRVHVALWPWLRLEGVDLELGHGVQFHADTIEATWPRPLRLAVRAATVSGPAGLRLGAPATVWDVTGVRDGDLKVTLVGPGAGLSIRKLKDPAGNAWDVQARELDIGHLFDVRREGRPLLDGGIATGKVGLQAGTDALHVHVDAGTRGARLPALADGGADEQALGDPTDLTLRFDADWRRDAGSLDIPEIQATVAGAAVSGSVALRTLDTDPAVDLAIGVRQLDFAQLLGASGLAVPDSLGLPPGGSHDLGSATIDLRVRGRLADLASLTVTQKIGFEPPREMPPAIARLRRDFIYRSDDGPGPHRAVDVSASSPDFIALRDVPPLFVRTLLLAEDSSFYGHRGVDFRELPTALLTNWSRGGAARGASTISQQLAKNLFLSRDKQLGRKLQELAITFLLESALGKSRILEIYLNIIEWGPDLRGLRPAARRYFGREPGALTPAEMAFLVVIIPGPIKYQSSFSHGSPGPGLTALIGELLAKLRSVNAIDEETYRRAIDEPLVINPGRPPG